MTLTGHAIEVRINAEDPAGGKFLPSPGPITKLRAPSGFGVRWDGGYEARRRGQPVLRQSRRQARSAGAPIDRRPSPERCELCANCEVEGVATTIPADIAILEHDDFAAVEHSTKWVEDVLDLSSIAGEVG